MINNHHQKHKNRPQNKGRERNQNLSEEEKNKRWKKAGERYQNFTEEEKKDINIIWNVRKSYLTIEEIII